MLRKLANLPPTAWVTAQTVLGQLIGLAVFAVQAPLLGPKAFGLVSIAMVFIGFCELVLNIGAMDALISIVDIEQLHYHTVTTVSVLVSVVLGVAIALGAGPLAVFFNEPSLEAIFQALAVLPLITSLGSSPSAATRREMQFRPLAVRAIVGQLAGGVVGIVLAWRGYGAWALAWQAIVQRFVSVAVLWIGAPIEFRFTISARHFQDARRYAVPVIVSSTMGWATGQIPRLILGYYLGAAELGLFSMAGRLFELVQQIALLPRFVVARVAFRRYADDATGRDDEIRRCVMQMGALCFPLGLGGAAALPALFHVWLGERWFGGILASQLMLLGIVPSVTIYTTGALLLAFRQPAADAFVSTMQALATVVIVWLAAPFGLSSSSAAIGVRSVLLCPLSLGIVDRKCGVPPRVVLAGQAAPLLAASLMAALVWILYICLEGRIGMTGLLVLLIGAGVVSYAALLAVISPDAADALRAMAARVSGRMRRPVA